MYNKKTEKKNIKKAIAIILSSPELTLDQLNEAIAYEFSNHTYTCMSMEGEYEAYSKAALELDNREFMADSRQQITIPLHEYLRLKAQEIGHAVGIDGGTIDYDCCCDA